MATKNEPDSEMPDAPSVVRESWTNDADLKQKHAKPRPSWLMTCMLAYSATGVIYGDIGTSPLYTVASILSYVDSPTDYEMILVISMIFWSLTLVVLIKYVLIVMHANDKGEGGTFALYTHACRTLGISPFGTLQQPEREQLKEMAKKYSDESKTREGPLIRGRRASRPGSGVRGPHTTYGVPAYTQSSPVSPANTLNLTVAHSTELTLSNGKPRKWWNAGHAPTQPIKRWFRTSWFAQRSLLFLAIIAVSMVFGDGVLTPAVSVVSAVSGLTVAANVDTNTVIGVSCAILVLLFLFQYRGTHSVSMFFSPIVILWLSCNAAIGVYNLVSYDATIVKALSPQYIYEFFNEFGADGWRMLGAVMLAVTGCEAMFADLGHFDVTSVSLSWALFAYPCLVITYLGQGAYLIVNPDDAGTVYWSSVPNAVFWPMLILATLASVVASQALISACFSICKQARALGFIPKIRIVHTSAAHDGQVYVSSANWILMILTIAVVAGFNADSTKMGNAYGLTISAVMLVTDILVALIMIVAWESSLVGVALFLAVYLLIDGAFISANLTKVPVGGWVAIAITCGVGLVFLVWWMGQRRKMQVVRSTYKPEELFTFTTTNARRALNLSMDGKGTTAHPGPIAEALEHSLSTHTRATYPALDRATHDTCSSELCDWIAADTTRAAAAAGPVAEGSEDGDAGRLMSLSSPKNSMPIRNYGLKAAPTRDELGLLRGELNLALRLPGLSSKPLATLPGIALFYSDNADTVPLVMCHFLRNVEAVHEINIFVCVRFMAIPYVAQSDRLLIRPVPGLPTFYQTVLRYGYMDTVNHGKAFVDWLITCIVQVLELRSGMKRTKTVINAVRESYNGSGPVAEGLMDLSSPSVVYSDVYGNNTPTHPEGTATNGGEVQLSANADPAQVVYDCQEIQVTAPPADAPDLKQPSPSVKVHQSARMALDLQHLTRVISTSSIGHELNRVMTARAVSLPRKASIEAQSTGYEKLLNMADAIENAEIEIPAVLEDSARRVAALIKAAGNGVVYYFGKSSLRMQDNSSFLHDLLYENLYKPMLLLSYAEHEAWRVPVDSLVELGMVVYL